MRYSRHPRWYQHMSATLVLAVVACAAAAQDQPAVVPPGAVGSSDIHDDTDGQSGGQVSMVGARNGTFSGKAVVASGRVTKAVMSDLAQGDLLIPASAVRVRFGMLWDQSIGSWTCPRGRDMLLESVPEGTGTLPIWITVKVPKDARAGAYAGRLTVEFKDGAPVAVPVTLDVRDWTLPDPQDYRSWLELVHQPDTLAVEYNLPLWSDQHWKMVARSLQLTADTGSRVIYIPLIAGSNYGNAESMVRWIKKDDNSYDHDFSILDRYLDLVDKHLGKPKITLCYAWEVYLMLSKQEAPPEVKGQEGSYEWRESMFAKSVLEHQGRGPVVTVLNQATGKTESASLPRYDDPAGSKLWQPVWDGVRKRLAARGWDQSMMIGMLSDRGPTREETAALNELSGGIPWTSCSHHFREVLPGKSLGKVNGIAAVGYVAVALDHQLCINPVVERLEGWKKPVLHAQYWRFQYFNTNPLCTVRNEMACQITGWQRGIGHLGADFWPCLRSKAGKRVGVVTDRFPQSYWHSLNIGSYMLGPGPDGPVGTARLEVLREGIQECEARLAIEDALADASLRARLGDDLAKRARDLLDQQQLDLWKARGLAEADLQLGAVREYRTFIGDITKRSNPKAGQQWFLTSLWKDRSGKLFTLAGQVAAKLQAK